jgi:cyanate permease
MGVSIAIGLLCAFMIGSSKWLADASAKTEDALTAEADAPQTGKVKVYRARESWTVREAVRTPQFYILLAAYFGHLLVGITVASLSPAYLVQRGVSASVAGGMLSLESLMGIIGRIGAGLIGDRLDPRYLLIFALVAMTAGSLALSVADSYPLMLLYAAGAGLGFGIAALALTVLLINYFGRAHNLEIFSLTCLIGALSALGPAVGGLIRDDFGSFTPAFQLFAAMTLIILVATLFMRPPIRRGAAYSETNEAPAAELVEKAA